MFFVTFNSDIWFWLNFGVIFDFLGRWQDIFGVGEGFKHYFGVYSCSWTTFVFYVLIKFNIWFLLNFGDCFLVLGALIDYIWGWGRVQQLIWGSNHVVEHFSFSMFLSFLTFDFDLVLWSFLTFWGPNGLFLGLGKGSYTVLGSTHVVEKLSFSMLPWILTFDFDLILGSFFIFGALMGYFWGWGRAQKLFWGLLI